MWEKLMLKEKDYEILTKGIASGVGIGIVIGAIFGAVVIGIIIASVYIVLNNL